MQEAPKEPRPCQSIVNPLLLVPQGCVSLHNLGRLRYFLRLLGNGCGSSRRWLLLLLSQRGSVPLARASGSVLFRLTTTSVLSFIQDQLSLAVSHRLDQHPCSLNHRMHIRLSLLLRSCCSFRLGLQNRSGSGSGSLLFLLLLLLLLCSCWCGNCFRFFLSGSSGGSKGHCDIRLLCPRLPFLLRHVLHGAALAGVYLLRHLSNRCTRSCTILHRVSWGGCWHGNNYRLLEKYFIYYNNFTSPPALRTLPISTPTSHLIYVLNKMMSSTLTDQRSPQGFLGGACWALPAQTSSLPLWHWRGLHCLQRALVGTSIPSSTRRFDSPPLPPPALCTLHHLSASVLLLERPLHTNEEDKRKEKGKSIVSPCSAPSVYTLQVDPGRGSYSGSREAPPRSRLEISTTASSKSHPNTLVYCG